MAVTIPTQPVFPDDGSIGLGETIYADGSSTSGTRGDSAPDTWQDAQETLNHVYAISPWVIASEGYTGSSDGTGGRTVDTSGTVTQLFYIPVHLPDGLLDVRLTSRASRDASATNCQVHLLGGSSGATVLVTNTHTGTSADTQSGTGSELTAGDKLFVVAVESNGTNGGTLFGWEVSIEVLTSGDIPA